MAKPKSSAQNKCGPRPATLEPHRSWILRSLPSRRLGQRNDGTGPTALTRMSATFTDCGCRAVIPGIAASATSAVASSPTQLREREVEEAAMPRQPARTRALPIFPRQFTLENYRFAAASPQSSWRASEGPTFSVNSLCGRSWRVATEKRFALVQKLWTIRLPCGRLRKTQNEPSFHRLND